MYVRPTVSPEGHHDRSRGGGMIGSRLKRLEAAARDAESTRCRACRDGTFPFVMETDRFGEEAPMPVDVASPYDDDGKCKTCDRAVRDPVVLVRPGG
jgi:hypothetical protein